MLHGLRDIQGVKGVGISGGRRAGGGWTGGFGQVGVWPAIGVMRSLAGA